MSIIDEHKKQQCIFSLKILNLTLDNLISPEQMFTGQIHVVSKMMSCKNTQRRFVRCQNLCSITSRYCASIKLDSINGISTAISCFKSIFVSLPSFSSCQNSNWAFYIIENILVLNYRKICRTKKRRTSIAMTASKTCFFFCRCAISLFDRFLVDSFSLDLSFRFHFERRQNEATAYENERVRPIRKWLRRNQQWNRITFASSICVCGCRSTAKDKSHVLMHFFSFLFRFVFAQRCNLIAFALVIRNWNVCAHTESEKLNCICCAALSTFDTIDFVFDYCFSHGQCNVVASQCKKKYFLFFHFCRLNFTGTNTEIILLFLFRTTEMLFESRTTTWSNSHRIEIYRIFAECEAIDRRWARERERNFIRRKSHLASKLIRFRSLADIKFRFRRISIFSVNFSVSRRQIDCGMFLFRILFLIVSCITISDSLIALFTMTFTLWRWAYEQLIEACAHGRMAITNNTMRMVNALAGQTISISILTFAFFSFIAHLQLAAAIQSSSLPVALITLASKFNWSKSI